MDQSRSPTAKSPTSRGKSMGRKRLTWSNTSHPISWGESTSAIQKPQTTQKPFRPNRWISAPTMIPKTRAAAKIRSHQYH